MPIHLYGLHELGYRTQYAELKERARAEPSLLPGTPGVLYERTGTGRPYWYRVYYAAPGRQVEDLVAARDDSEALTAMLQRIDFAKWAARQVADLRKLEFQVADKSVARVLVELYNRRLSQQGFSSSARFATWRGSTIWASRQLP